MFYEARLPLPANTLEAAAVEQDLNVHPGLVTRVEIQFPPGCAGLAHVQVIHWERQLWPSNPDSSFTGDTFPIAFAEDYELRDPPFALTLRGWNLDELYTHTPIVRVQVAAFKSGPLDALAALFGGNRGLLIPGRQ